MTIGGIDVGVKTILGFVIMGIGFALQGVGPYIIPGLPWDAIAKVVIGFGMTLAGIGARHAIAKAKS